MDPRMTAAAMEQMKKMSPEQISQMMAAVQNIPPDQMQSMMAQMNTMSPQDWERAQAQMNNLDPAQVAKEASAMGARLSAQQEYVVNGSDQLKGEGNKLFSAGRYAEAAEKYTRAQSNLSGLQAPRARDLRRAVTLNLAACHLSLGNHRQCVTECDAVLEEDGSNLKALYRRGQARAALGQLPSAVADLEAAVKLAERDPAQQPVIAEKLAAARAKLAAGGGGQDADGGVEVVEMAGSSGRARGGATATTTTFANGCVIEEVTGAREAGGGSSSGRSAAAAVIAGSTGAGAAARATPGGAAAAPLGGGIDPQQLRQMAELMERNPEMMQQASRMMASMPREQLAAMASSMGHTLPPDMDPSAVVAAMASADHLNPSTVRAMADMASAAGNGGAASPAQLAAAAKAMQDNPEMLKGAVEMMRSLGPEQLQRMAQQAGVPGGEQLTPEMLSMAAEKLSAMPPEALASMAQAATASRAAAAGAAGAGGGAGDVAAAMSGMQEALAGMRPEELAALADAANAGPGGGAGGPALPAGMPHITPEMMKAAASMMQHMKPEDLAAMQRLAGDAGLDGVAGGSGFAPGSLPPGMMQRMQDPAMVEGMLTMVQGMDEEALASMLIGSGMARDQETALKMAEQVKGMSPAQVKLMARFTSVATAGAAWWEAARAWIASRQALVVALLVLLVAVLLRWLGVM